MSDEELMRRVRTGELSLMGELFERHHQTLFRFVWRMTGRAETSDDIVQEVFARMIRHRASFADGNRFQTWMFSIARNAFTDLWRRRRRETGLGEIEPAAAVGETVERHQEAALLHRTLLALPEAQREVIVMSRFLGLRHAEIASLLGCDETTARVRLHRALAALRELYGADLKRRVS
jgi:RNA polymerase sigma-70 factor (ECF subfamily)